MADGRVLVSGGSAVNNAATGVAYTAEIFNPATGTWTTADRDEDAALPLDVAAAARRHA